MKLLRMTSAAAAVAVGASLGVLAKETSETTRDVASFNQVRLNGSMDVEIKVGGEQSVRIVADSDIIERIKTEVRDDTLFLKLERGTYRNIRKMAIYITVPSLTGAAVHGSGDMVVEDAEADDFELELHGSGDAIFKDAKFGRIEIDLHGSGDIEIDGTCDFVDAKLQGSGDIDADDMACRTAKVKLHGSGDVSVHAGEEADVSVFGSGDVAVSGSPDKVRTEVRGSGDIEMR